MKSLTVTEPRKTCDTPIHRRAFLEYLCRENIRAICLRHRRFPRLSLLQDMFLQVMVWGACIEKRNSMCLLEECHSCKGGRLCIGHGKGGEKVDAIISYRNKPCNTRKELFGMIEEYKPLIVIDLGLVASHLGRELRSLRVQVGAALGVIRRYLWDRHLLLSSARPGVIEWLRAFMGRALFDYSELPGDEAAYLRGANKIIVLDPSAEKPLTSNEALNADAFIIGGIIDILPRPGATRRLDLRGLGEPRKITLRGSIHGVPSRLPQITEIVLRARYETCDVEEAVRRVMSPRDARLRAFIELMKWSRGRRKQAPLALYYELREWLPISLRDFVRAARMAKLEVEELEGAQQRPNSSQEHPR